MSINDNTERSIMWISVSITIIIGLFITKSANCLWGFLIPLLLY